LEGGERDASLTPMPSEKGPVNIKLSNLKWSENRNCSQRAISAEHNPLKIKREARRMNAPVGQWTPPLVVRSMLDRISEKDTGRKGREGTNMAVGVTGEKSAGLKKRETCGGGATSTDQTSLHKQDILQK